MRFYKSLNTRLAMAESSLFDETTLEEQSLFTAFNVFRRELASSLTTDNGNRIISRLLLLAVIQMRTCLYDAVCGADAWMKNEKFASMLQEIDATSTSIVCNEPWEDQLSEQNRAVLSHALKTLQRVCVSLGLKEPKDMVEMFVDPDADYRAMMNNSPDIADVVMSFLAIADPCSLDTLGLFWDRAKTLGFKKRSLATADEGPPTKRAKALNKL